MAQAEDLPICMLCFQPVFHLSQLYCFECWHSVAADPQQKLQDRAPEDLIIFDNLWFVSCEL